MSALACETDLSGASPPLFLLHPLGADLRIWNDCCERWQGEHSIVRYDRAGAGSSPTPDRPYTLGDHVTELEALRADLGIETLIPVGNAIGALVAAMYAAAEPSRVPGLVLVDPAVGRRDAGSSLLDERISAVEAGGMAAILPGAVDRAFHRQPHDDRYRAYLNHFGAQDPNGYIHSMRSSIGAELSEVYPAIECPVLVVAGEHDLLFPPEEAERVVSLLPNAEYVLFEGVAHFPPYQAPDRLASVVTDFVRRQVS